MALYLYILTVLIQVWVSNAEEQRSCPLIPQTHRYTSTSMRHNSSLVIRPTRLLRRPTGLSSACAGTGYRRVDALDSHIIVLYRPWSALLPTAVLCRHADWATAHWPRRRGAPAGRPLPQL